MDIVGALLIEGSAGFTLVACLAVCCGAHAVDCFSKDTGTSCFSHASWTAKKIGMRQFSGGNGVLQGSGQCTLATTDSKVEDDISVQIRYSFPYSGYSLLFVQMYTKKRNLSVIPLIFVT